MDSSNISSSASSICTHSLEERVGVITMNNPAQANAFSSELVAKILQAMDEMEQAGIRVLVLRAYPGARVWSSGHNISEIKFDGQDPLHCEVPFEKLIKKIRHYPVPVIAMIEGTVWGGACELALCCDLLVATPATSFAISPAQLGLPYNIAGVAHFLEVLPLHIIKELFFTAKPLSAADAWRYGLLNRLVEVEQLEATAMQLARNIAGNAPLVLTILKRELEALTDGPSLDPRFYEEIQCLRTRAYNGHDFREGVQAFFEKRPPRFIGE